MYNLIKKTNMKNILKYLVLLFGVAAFATSCTNDPVDYAWPEEESGLKLWFSESATTAYELAENQSSISFYLYRNQTDNALEVPINVECVTEEAFYEDAEGNAACIFELPTTAKFEAGSDVAQMRVLFTFSEIEPEREYEFELAVADEENNSIYGAAELEFSIASYPDWADAGWGTLDFGALSMFSIPSTFSSYQPIQNKAGTNLYRWPNFAAYYMENNYDVLINDMGYTDEEYAEELEYLWGKNTHIVFQLNDSNKSDGGNDWDFYNMAEGVQDEESLLYGKSFYNYFIGTSYFFPFCTENYNANLAKYCSFYNDSSVDRKYYIELLMAASATGSVYLPGPIVFDWKENPLYTGDSWEIKTDFNADFEYIAGKKVAFTPAGFPELGTYDVEMLSASNKEDLFYLADAFGVEGYGLAVFVNDDKVTIPADQPTGRVQNGMMVYAGPSGASMIDVDGNLKLSLEYYMIEEKTIMPEGGAEELPVQPDGEQVVPAVDPDDDRFEWPSGVVGKGERYEIVEAEETPDAPAADPEPIVTTRRISLGTFEEIASTSGYAPAALEDFIGEYAIEAENYGPAYLGDYAEYYPYVAEAVALNVKIEAGEKDDEVIISGLFSNIPNGDTYFADFAGKDKVVGVYNRIGGYIMIQPQALKDKVTVLGDEATGKPSVDFAVNFAPYFVADDAEAGIPVMVVKNGDAIYFMTPSDEYAGKGFTYTFICDYDGGTMMNFDLPALPMSGLAAEGAAPEMTVTAAIDEGEKPARELWGSGDTNYFGVASVNGMLNKVKLTWEVTNAEYDKIVIDNGKAVLAEITDGSTSYIVENVNVSPAKFNVTAYNGRVAVAYKSVETDVYLLPKQAAGAWEAKIQDDGYVIYGRGWNTAQYATAQCIFNVYEVLDMATGALSETPVFSQDIQTNAGSSYSYFLWLNTWRGVQYSDGGNNACHGGDGNNWHFDEANLPAFVKKAADGKWVFSGLDPEKTYAVAYTLKVWPYILNSEDERTEAPSVNENGQTVMKLFFKKIMAGGAQATMFDAINLQGLALLAVEKPAAPEPEPGEGGEGGDDTTGDDNTEGDGQN